MVSGNKALRILCVVLAMLPLLNFLLYAFDFSVLPFGLGSMTKGSSTGNPPADLKLAGALQFIVLLKLLAYGLAGLCVISAGSTAIQVVRNQPEAANQAITIFLITGIFIFMVLDAINSGMFSESAIKAGIFLIICNIAMSGFFPLHAVLVFRPLNVLRGVAKMNERRHK